VDHLLARQIGSKVMDYAQCWFGIADWSFAGISNNICCAASKFIEAKFAVIVFESVVRET